MVPICVPSLGKAGKSSTLNKIVLEEEVAKNTYVFVYSFDIENYRAAYPSLNFVDVGETKNLPNKRNKILEYAEDNNWKNIIMIDDDIKGFAIKGINDEKYTRLSTFSEFIKYIENVANQLNGDYTMISPRWNFISTDKLNEGNLLIEYSQLANLFYINMEKMKGNRFNQMMLEDIDMYISLVLKGHKLYKLRQIQAYSTLAEAGGYQVYMDVSTRYMKGIEQLHNKYKNSESFIYATKLGYAGMKKPAFVRWLKEYHPEVKIHDLPIIEGF